MRRHYLDNVRWSVIMLVLVFHVVAIFSSCRAPMSFNAPGIPAMDVVGYLVYPWFMTCLFVVGGVTARIVLERRGAKGWLRGRARRLLVPFVTYVVLLGPFASSLSFMTTDAETTLSALPAPVVLAIRIVSGMGPAWFLPQMYLCGLALALVRTCDRGGALERLGARCDIGGLLLLWLPVFASAQVLYLVWTFRVGLYVLAYLLGYFVFSQDAARSALRRWSGPLVVCACVLGVASAVASWGQVFQQAVDGWLVMLYTWIAVLAVMGCADRWWNRTGRVSTWMTSHGFGIYLFHYVPMVWIAYALTTFATLPVALDYALTFAGALAAAVVLEEAVGRIPVLGSLFGLSHPVSEPDGGKAASAAGSATRDQAEQ